MRQSTSSFSSRALRALPLVAVVTLAMVATTVPAFAQTDGASTSGSNQRPTSGSDRLFRNFFEEATIVDGQWWEGRVEFADYDEFDTTIVRGVAAFGLTDNLEVGGTVGFGSSSSSNGLPDGTGATDLDAYAKYYFGGGDGKSEFAAGAIVTVPTGDDNAGLGNDAFALGAFGSMRYRLKSVILGGNVGFRLNGDASRFGSPDQDGKFSASLGFGAIIPLSDRLAVVAETRFETKRYENADEFFSVLGGVNWRVSNRGAIRAAVEIGLDDAAPDYLLTVGYAHTF